MTEYRYRADELLVHVDDCDLIQTELAAQGYRRADRSGALWRFVGEPSGRAVPELLAGLRARHGEGLRVSPNHVFGCDRIIWGWLHPRATLDALPGLPAVPDGEDPVKVGVIDTGIVLHEGKPHPYLERHVVFGPDDEDPVTVDGEGNPTGSDGHGTFVTGVILHEAPNARVHMKGVIDKSTGELEDLAVAKAIDSLREAGVGLINLSFSGGTWEDKPPQGIENALRRLDQDVVVVASAGNRGSSQVLFPAALELGERGADIVGVGAAHDGGEHAPPADPVVAVFSGYGPWVQAYASGVDVLGPYFRPGYPTRFQDGNPLREANGFAVWSGSSFASAIVTGRIAARMAGGVSAAAAWAELLHSDEAGTISVYGVNGKDTPPYFRATPTD